MLTPFDAVLWTWGMWWGSACLALEPWTVRTRPPVPTREAIAAELAAEPAPCPELARVTARPSRRKRRS